jgi:hypothetical protein
LCGVSSTKSGWKNAYFKAKDLNVILSAPKEHQLLIGLYCKHLLPATMYVIEKNLRNPNTNKGYDKNGAQIKTISQQSLMTVFSRLRNRLDCSTSTIDVTTEYASHFYDVYIRQHDGKHMTVDRMKILRLNLQFLLRDLLRPEVRYINITISYSISGTTSYLILYSI